MEKGNQRAGQNQACVTAYHVVQTLYIVTGSRYCASLVLCCDQFDCGSREVKREQVDLATQDYDEYFVS